MERILEDRRKERKSSSWFVSFPYLLFPSLILPVYRKNSTTLHRILQLSSEQRRSWGEGVGWCVCCALQSPRSCYKGSKTNMMSEKVDFFASNKLLSYRTKYKEIQQIIVIFSNV
jgi:hypothetical protein